MLSIESTRCPNTSDFTSVSILRQDTHVSVMAVKLIKFNKEPERKGRPKEREVLLYQYNAAGFNAQTKQSLSYSA